MDSTNQSIYFHERPITDIKFHRDGDVFFASSKDCSASMTNLNGQILGSFNKHTGAISTLESYNNNLYTASVDLSIIQWDVFKGNAISTIPTDSLIRGLFCSDQIYFCTDDSMGRSPAVGLLDIRTNKTTKIANLSMPSSKLFEYQNCLIVSTANGTVLKVDLRNGQVIQEATIHQSKIADMKPSFCRSFFVTASTDSSAKIVDSETFAIKKRFDCEEPINSACIFNTNDKVICAGGINARDVTTTKGKSSFETSFFDIVTQLKIGSFNTHFGTINAVDVHPIGSHYISGGEDGSICLVRLGKNFFDAPFTDFN